MWPLPGLWARRCTMADPAFCILLGLATSNISQYFNVYVTNIGKLYYYYYKTTFNLRQSRLSEHCTAPKLSDQELQQHRLKVSHTVQACLFSRRLWDTKNRPNVTWSKLRIFPLNYGCSWNCSCAFIAFHRIHHPVLLKKSNSATGKTATAVNLMCQSKRYRMICCKKNGEEEKKKVSYVKKKWNSLCKYVVECLNKACT